MKKSLIELSLMPSNFRKIRFVVFRKGSFKGFPVGRARGSRPEAARTRPAHRRLRESRFPMLAVAKGKGGTWDWEGRLGREGTRGSVALGMGDTVKRGAAVARSPPNPRLA